MTEQNRSMVEIKDVKGKTMLVPEWLTDLGKCWGWKSNIADMDLAKALKTGYEKKVLWGTASYDHGPLESTYELKRIWAQVWEWEAREKIQEVVDFCTGRLMSAEDVLDKFEEYLDRDAEKDDFFALCSYAHKKGYFKPDFEFCLTSEAIQFELSERWKETDKETRKEKLAGLNKILPMWDEWKYTLEKISMI